MERPYPPIPRGPAYPESLETTKEIEKHINELLEMDVIRKIGHNDIMKISTSVLITWNDGKYTRVGISELLITTQKLTGTLYHGYLMPYINWKKPNT
ncbi:hypothetical protein O181_116933 [Austropuccinia psidii MF-1]|uniref:Uncharacterized protein n=1 Tax=Austropuccinia psidii MF-1 TaxID=1389203 RepID=A0A9Q3PX10_9BASI|nr:hypothetical protein [Austropuccinia psidii MF-1]